ncbi:MAG: CubicO group peptidase (beta-lactamase class C family) [Gammaproteobacteria bacterium]|jgi:CubicO group peptidase (beta-lactamase class C family)
MSTFPPSGRWHDAIAGDHKADANALQTAAAFATQAETTWPRGLGAGLNSDPANNEPPPWNEVLGPTVDRAGPNGMIVRHGHCIERWGDTTRADMSFSVAKSYLAVLAGIALRDGLISSFDDRVADSALDDGFECTQNSTITWRHFLTQTSEWQGTLWSKPDLIDHHRQVGVGADNTKKGTRRDLRAPGSFYEYNDVRVNRFSLALLHVFREPLAQVLKREVMDPIGASETWQWHGYNNSTVNIDGQDMCSVPGGSHWGGGLFMSTEDHARFGLMVLNDGCWNARRILPVGYAQALRTPSPVFANYGLLWWLNTNRRQYANAPQTSYFAMGAGSSLIWLDPQLDLVSVVRWIDQTKINDWIATVLAALHE